MEPERDADDPPQVDPEGQVDPLGETPEQELLGREGARSSSRDPRKRITTWFERRATKVVHKVYEDRAEDLQERAAKTIGTIYEERADDLEERAVRAMRRAIEGESERIRIAIEHGVAVKKREVRLSLMVLAVSSVIYLVLYLLTR